MTYTKGDKNLILDKVREKVVPDSRRVYNSALGVSLGAVDVVELPEEIRSKYPSFAGDGEALCVVTPGHADMVTELDERTRQRYGRSFFHELRRQEDHEEQERQNKAAIEELGKQYNLDSTIFVFPDFWETAREYSPVMGGMDAFLFYTFGHELIHLYQRQQGYIRPFPFIKDGFADFSARSILGMRIPSPIIENGNGVIDGQRLYLEFMIGGMNLLAHRVSRGQTLANLFKQGEYADLDEEALESFLNQHGFLKLTERARSFIGKKWRRALRSVWQE